MSLHAIVNAAWQLFRDRELIAQATADADLLHIVELRRKDGSAINLAALLPDGWATNQDLSDPAKAMSAMAWRIDAYELVEAHEPLLLSRAGKGVRARYLSHVDLREKATGRVRRYGAAHAPLLITGRKGEWQRNLAAFLRAHPDAIVGGDGNVRRMRRLSKRLGRPVVGREVMFLALPAGGSVTVTTERVRSSDHPILRANVRDLPKKEKPAMAYYRRSDWGARRAKSSTPLDALSVEGLAFHWPAMSKPLRGVEAVMAALRGWQDFHMDDRGWSDIAYQEAVDQDGNAYELRGLGTRSAANGDAGTNGRFGAMLLILAPGESPSPAMIATVRQRVAAHRARFSRSRRLVGHGEIRPGGTECPGPAVRRLIASGAFEPVAPTPSVPKPLPPTELSRTREHLTAWRKRLGARRPRVRAAIDAFLKGTPKR